MEGKIELKVTGKVHRLKDIEEFSGGFKKRTVVLMREIESGFPQFVPIDFIKDHCDKLDKCAKGDDVTITATLGGREWEGHDKFFLSLTGWGVTMVQEAEREDGPPAPMQPPPAQAATPRSWPKAKPAEEYTAGGDIIPF